MSRILHQGVYNHTNKQINRRKAVYLFIGRGERIRTFDPYNPIVVRYQTAPRPDSEPARDNLVKAAACYMKRGIGKRVTDFV